MNLRTPPEPATPAVKEPAKEPEDPTLPYRSLILIQYDLRRFASILLVQSIVAEYLVSPPMQVERKHYKIGSFLSDRLSAAFFYIDEGLDDGVGKSLWFLSQHKQCGR